MDQDLDFRERERNDSDNRAHQHPETRPRKRPRILVKAIKMALQNPLPHWGRSSARPWGSTDGSGSAGFVKESCTRRRSSRRVWRGARWRCRTRVLICEGLGQSRSAKGESSQKVACTFGVCLCCGIRGRGLGEPSCNGRTGSPCVNGNWRLFVHFFVFENGRGAEFAERESTGC